MTTGRERTRRWRARLAGELPPVTRCSCGALLLRGGPLCRRCWLQTAEGREWNRERMAARRRVARSVTRGVQ
jgi:hypothetical protein